MGYTESEDARLYWLGVGRGPGLLFCHGAGGNAASWFDQVDRFRDQYSIVAYDQRGFGRSSRPDGPVDVDGLVADGLAVMNAAGLEKTTFVGQSLGGWTGLRLALREPDRIERLVLCCTMAGVAHQPAVDSFMASLAKQDDRGVVSVAVGHELHRDNPLKAYAYEQINAFSTPIEPEIAAPIFAPDNLIDLEELAGVRCPAMVIAGENDLLWPPHVLEGIAAAIPGARFEVIPDCGHSAYYERPAVFNELLADFLGA